jgi:hypothetical protein
MGARVRPIDGGDAAPTPALRPRICRSSQKAIAMFAIFQAMPLTSAAA